MCAPVLAEVAAEWGEQTSINPYTKILRLTSIEHQTVFNTLTHCLICAPQIPKCALNSGQIRQLTTPQLCHGNLRYYAFACNVLYLSVLILIFLLCVQLLAFFSFLSQQPIIPQIFTEHLPSGRHWARFWDRLVNQTPLVPTVSNTSFMFVNTSFMFVE